MNETNIVLLDLEAKELALRDVKNMLQRPGQLEKVDQYRNRARRKLLLEITFMWKCW